MKIRKFRAYKIFNSIGQEAVEVEITDDSNLVGRASAPSGSSVGKHEVMAYSKEGINSTVEIANKEMSKTLMSRTVETFEDLDRIEMALKNVDNTKKLERIGGNVIIATELAILNLASKGKLWKFLGGDNQKMPFPLGNCVGGGKHIVGIGPDIQEFLALPKAQKFYDSAHINIELHNQLAIELKKRDKNFTGSMTYEGAWTSTLPDLHLLEIFKKTADNVSKELKTEIGIGIDLASSELWNGRKYEYKKYSNLFQKKIFSPEQQMRFIKNIIINYGLIYIEDPLHEDDFENYKILKEEMKDEKVLICGDDLVATNPERLKKAINCINAVIVKPNQIGSLIKTKEVIDIAKQNKIIPVLSHRSGEVTFSCWIWYSNN